jgi:hypothetical protein
MKKVTLLSLVLSALVLGSCYRSQDPKSDVILDSTGKAVSSVDAPIISFDQDIFNFGVIYDGDVVEHEFSFTNTGKTPLIISGAEATCGCTVPSIPDKPINPGEKGKIVVAFNSSAKVGMHDKVVTLTTNANPAFAYLHMVGEVKPKKQ